MWHVNCKFAALNRPYGISLKQCILTRWMCVQSHKEDTAKANQPLNIQFVGKICLLFLPYVMYAIYLNWCVSCSLFLFLFMIYVILIVRYMNGMLLLVLLVNYLSFSCIVFWKLVHISYPTEFIRHSEWLLHNVPISIFGMKFDYESKLPITCKRYIWCNAWNEDDTPSRDNHQIHIRIHDISMEFFLILDKISKKRCPIPSVLSEVSLLQTIINHLIPWRILTFSNLFD